MPVGKKKPPTRRAIGENPYLSGVMRRWLVHCNCFAIDLTLAGYECVDLFLASSSPAASPGSGFEK